MIIQRDLIKKIEPFIKRNEFISIAGPRQSGKTTFLGLLKEDLHTRLKVDKELIKIITFEDRKLLLEFENDPVSFVRSFIPDGVNHKFYLMIDEFQYVQDGGQKLKLVYDTVKKVKIFITGSSSLNIKANVGKFMVGRILNFYLFPFNFCEYLRFHNERLERVYSERNHEVKNFLFKNEQIKIKPGEDFLNKEFVENYEKFSIWGGYPVVVLTESITEKKQLLTDIYNGYILKDIKTLLELATERNLFLLSQHLATQVGNIIVYKNLSQISGLNYRKLIKHLNILYETFVCRQVKPFFKNRQKELSKNPKIYFLDMGFRNHLMENMNSLQKRADAGSVIENTCFIRINEICEDVNKINFWRTKAGAEVDFVIHTGDKIIPVEIKYSPFKREKISKGFASFIDYFNSDRAIVLTKNYWGNMRRNKTRILFVPVYYL